MPSYQNAFDDRYNRSSNNPPLQLAPMPQTVKSAQSGFNTPPTLNNLAPGGVFGTDKPTATQSPVSRIGEDITTGFKHAPGDFAERSGITRGLSGVGSNLGGAIFDASRQAAGTDNALRTAIGNVGSYLMHGKEADIKPISFESPPIQQAQPLQLTPQTPQAKQRALDSAQSGFKLDNPTGAIVPGGVIKQTLGDSTSIYDKPITPIQTGFAGLNSNIPNYQWANANPQQANASPVPGITKTTDNQGRVTYAGKGEPLQLTPLPGDNRNALDRNLGFTGNPVTDMQLGAVMRGEAGYDALQPQLASAVESGRQTNVTAQKNLAEQNSPEQKILGIKERLINVADEDAKARMLNINNPLSLNQLEAKTISQLSNPDQIKYFQNSKDKAKRFIPGQYGKLFDTVTGQYVDQDE